MAASEEDLRLAAAVASGDGRAAEILFERLFDGLYRAVCARLDGDHHAAEDVVSETLHAGLRSLGRFRGEAGLATWFFRIAEHKIADRKRSRAAALVLGGDGDLESIFVPGAQAPLDRLADEETRSFVRAALDSLPERHQTILRWKYFDDSTLLEVAVRLQVTPKAAERRLARARQALAVALRKNRFSA